MTDPTAAETASMLAEVRAANAELARRAVAPVWYHPALGLLAGGLAVVQAADPPWAGVYYAAFSLGLLLLVAAYKKHTGLWVSGFRPGRTRTVAIALSVLLVGILLGTSVLARLGGVVWAPYAGGALVTILTTAAGFAWEAALRRDLAEGDRL